MLQVKGKIVSVLLALKGATELTHPKTNKEAFYISFRIVRQFQNDLTQWMGNTTLMMYM